MYQDSPVHSHPQSLMIVVDLIHCRHSLYHLYIAHAGCMARLLNDSLVLVADSQASVPKIMLNAQNIAAETLAFPIKRCLDRKIGCNAY